MKTDWKSCVESLAWLAVLILMIVAIVFLVAVGISLVQDAWRLGIEI